MAKQKSRFPSYGLVRGPSHERGGVAGMVAGEQPVELEGGEWIIPKEAVPDYLPVLKQITNEGRAMQQMQNGNSAMDALIASATMEAGISEAKSPMFQEGGAVSDNTRVAMNEFMPDISYDLPTFDGKTKERQYSMSNMPMSDEEMMDIAMGMATPGSAMGSLAKKASKIATQRDLLGKFYKDPISGLSKKGMLKLVKEAVPDNTIGVYGEPLSYFKNLKTDELADVLRSAYGLARNPNVVKEKAGVGTAAYLTNMGREGVDFALRDIKDLKIKEQGGMVDEYEGGGQLHSRRMYNQKDKKKYGYEMGGMMPEYQDGGEVSWDDFTTPEEYNTHFVQSKVYDKMSQRNGKTNDYADSLIKNIALSEAGDPKQYTMDRMMEQSTSGNGAKQFGVIEDSEFKDFESGLQMGSELTATPRFKVEKEYAKEGDLEKRTGSSREQVSLGGLPGLSYLANLASKSGVSPESLVGKLFNAPLPLTLEKDIPSGKKAYKLGYSPQYQDGGMIKQYQQGGQMQPRKQQEIRNPQMYGPPDSLMGPDTTMGNLDDLLNYYMESDRRNKLNALTGDTIDPQLDSLRLLQRMQKSKMPTYGRKNMQQGGQVLGKGQPLERRPSPSEQLAAMQAMEARPQDSLMSSMGEDKRVRPADKYIIKDGTMSKREMEVPKLSSAYLQSFGMETPLSKRQNDLLRHRALSPETLGINPQVQSLLGKALVQRLSNEPI